MSDERIWTAAVLVIGDEILSGRTQDKNVSQIATWLDVQGIRLREVRIVPDVEDEIVAALNAVRAIESGQHRSEEGVTQVTEAGATLQLITNAVEAIRDMNRQIATAAEEQTSVAEDISRNLTEITAIASSNQENVQRTESAGRNLHELSGQLNEVTQRLSA